MQWFLKEEFEIQNYSDNIKWPKISIITPTYNYGHLIEETILSVINQNYPNLEFIIIDGGSTDNTGDIIKKYKNYISYWISEKDTGQPSAINKGLKICTGEIFNWLNSDDYLEKGALYHIAKTFVEKKSDLVAGVVRYFDDKGFEEVNPNQNLSAKGVMCWDKEVKFIQPGVWLKLKNLTSINGVDEDQKMRFAFDWDMIIRYLYFYSNVTYINNVLVHYRFHPISNTVSDPERYSREEAYIIEKLNKNEFYKGLHQFCRNKIRRRKWTETLANIGQMPGSSRTKKIVHILSKLYMQPWGDGVARMTAGAIRQILLKNKIKLK